MGAELKAAGKAVAILKGHYPDEAGRHLTILPGQTFTVWEGLTKGKWFQMQEKGAPAPKIPQKETPPPGPETLTAAAIAERKRKAANKAPTEDDIA